MDATIHSHIAAPLQQAIVYPFLAARVFYLQPHLRQYKQDNIPWTPATLSQHEPICVGCPTRMTCTCPTY
jgi:hypothetical protein